VTATARTAAERAKLRDAILAELPWATPDGEIDHAFASELAGYPGGVAEQVRSWLRRVQVPATGALLVALAVLQSLS
jgi:hypothetical protein